MAKDSTTNAGDVLKPPVCRCSKGHMKNANHITTVLLNMKTTRADYDSAVVAGYCVERRWDGVERRRT
jgi:hypothetical protein